ncbi:MAG: Flagellar hook-length control protein FliK [Myxococcales bacterium]|nr:Flagellar hook-length control protein FliK [Myxococcales bacterium]
MGWRWLLVLTTCASCLFKPQPSQVQDADPSGVTNLAFVSSRTYVLNMFANDASLADRACSDLAHQASPPHGGNFVAWLSMGRDAKSVIGNARGWVRSDGKPFADQLEDLIAGKIYYPLELDETGLNVTGSADVSVATGTRQDGTRIAGSDCTSGMVEFGTPDAGAPGWTEVGTLSCSSNLHLYCLQIDHAVPVAPTSGNERRVFVTDGTFGPSAGLSAADAICDTEKGTLSGTFRALLATDTAVAHARFNNAPTPWRRLDGVVVTSDWQTFTAPITVTPTQKYVSDLVYIGAPTADSLASGHTCASWTDPMALARTYLGISDRSSTDGFGSYSSNGSCTVLNHLYCVEQ